MSIDAARWRIDLSSRLRAVAAPLLLMALIISLWQFLVWLLEIQAYVLPAPSAIAAEIISERAVIFSQLKVTLFEIFAGYLLAVAVGFVLSVLIVYLPAFRRGVLPLIVASQTIPVIAIAPILVIWFGYNALPRIIITALVAFFPLTVNFVTGLQSVSAEFINFFRSLNASEAQIFRKLRFPAALPNVFAGLKVASHACRDRRHDRRVGWSQRRPRLFDVAGQRAAQHHAGLCFSCGARHRRHGFLRGGGVGRAFVHAVASRARAAALAALALWRALAAPRNQQHARIAQLVAASAGRCVADPSTHLTLPSDGPQTFETYGDWPRLK